MANKEDKENKDALDRLRRDVGERLKTIRTKGLKLSQEKFGESIPDLEGKNLQVRIASLEKGRASNTTVYAVMKFLYNEGVNINYVFGDEESLLRIGKEVSLYPENIIDYLNDVLVSAGKATAIVSEITESTKRVEEYVQRTIELSEEKASSQRSSTSPQSDKKN